jgi:4-coumarate--CoA ligase
MSASMSDWLVHGRDVHLSVLPMYHIYVSLLFVSFLRSVSPSLVFKGAVQTLHYCFLVAVPVVVMPKFEPIQFFTNIEKYRITHIYVVPPILVGFAKHPGELA